MQFRNISIIIGREYLNRVKKKSFLIITFAAPILFAALCILPSVIMMGAKEEAKKIAVVDSSGIMMDKLSDTETISYSDCTGTPVDSLKNNLDALGFDAYLVISPLDSLNNVSAVVSSFKPLGMETSGIIQGQINNALEEYRASVSGVQNIQQIISEIKANVHVISLTIGEDGEEKMSESSVYMMVSMVLGMIIYIFIAIFGSMVMSSVIEEKASRVVEVLVSSVKATELMFGKIIGVALVAITQFLLWIALTGGILFVVTQVAGPEMISEMAQSAQATQLSVPDAVRGEQMLDVVAQSAAAPEGVAIIFATLSNMPFAKILVSFLIYFIFGYMLYASLFAAIGSAVENEGDTNQLQIPITIPLLIGFFIAIYAFKSPDSDLVFWGSMVPFTSPIVMLARLPYDVPMIELVISILALVVTFCLFAWASAKIYKVGILMFGKKSTWADLWKWFRMK